MKQVTKCDNCKNIIRLAGSFTAEMADTIVITNEYGNPESRTVKKKIRLCRKCSFNAGYKVKGDEFTPKLVFSPSHDPNNPFTNRVK